MRFFREEDTYKIVKTSGPLHNFLAISFAEGPDTPVELEAVALDLEESKVLSEEEVKLQVEAGVKTANLKFGCSFYLAHISYVASDSLPVETYYSLAFNLIQHLSSGGHFEEMSSE